MTEASGFRSGRHVVFKLHVHLVFVTKYRRGVITDRVREFLKEAMEKVCLDFEAELMEFDGEDDHVHLLIAYPPKVAISAMASSQARDIATLSLTTSVLSLAIFAFLVSALFTAAPHVSI